jgi:hypothetical protein
MFNIGLVGYVGAIRWWYNGSGASWWIPFGVRYVLTHHVTELIGVRFEWVGRSGVVIVGGVSPEGCGASRALFNGGIHR